MKMNRLTVQSKSEAQSLSAYTCFRVQAASSTALVSSMASLLKLAGITLVVGGMVGCSVRQASVSSRPPEIKREISQAAVESGMIKPESISFFFWPEGLSALQLRTIVNEVSSLSQTFDQYSKTIFQNTNTRDQLLAEFRSQECAARWSNLGPTDVAADIEYITSWKQATPDDLVGNEALQKCQKNQENRKDVTTKTDLVAEAQISVLKKIYVKIDADYPLNVVNWLSIENPKNSKILIRDASEAFRVDISIQNFMRKGNKVATDAKIEEQRISSASYDPQTKSLRFSIPEISSAGASTGAHFEFELGRNSDFLGQARFTGDMRLVRDGVVLRQGSAKIEGRIQ
jgi:hypothetical protein